MFRAIGIMVFAILVTIGVSATLKFLFVKNNPSTNQNSETKEPKCD